MAFLRILIINIQGVPINMGIKWLIIYRLWSGCIVTGAKKKLFLLIKCVKSCIDLREINTAFCLYPVIVLLIEWRRANFPAPHQTRGRALIHRSEDGDKEDRRVRLISPRRSLAEKGSRRSSYPRYIFHQYLIPFDSFYIINKVFVSCLSVQKEFYIMNIYFSFFFFKFYDIPI